MPAPSIGCTTNVTYLFQKVEYRYYFLATIAYSWRLCVSIFPVKMKFVVHPFYICGMKHLGKTLLILLLLCPLSGWSWGKTGHRIIGEIAERHLTRKARKALQQIMGHESLAMSSNYMDFIKSDTSYNHMSPWHYVNIPAGGSYDTMTPSEQGDVVQTIERLLTELKTKQFTDEDELFAIRCLVHLVGDVHQPLHVGRADDRGGNDVRITWFGQASNLHRVWDTDMIAYMNLSYTEYANHLDHASKQEIKVWQSHTVRDWAHESQQACNRIYQMMPERTSWRYRYVYDHIATLEQQLLKAGIRLAGVLNEIYG